jgi:5-hydroxyisourate hydrolase
VLDIARGCPASGVSVILDARRGPDWVRVASGTTDDRGRLMSLTDSIEVVPGLYRLTFDTGGYERERSATQFFPEAQVTFLVEDASEDFHVPLVFSPFGYSTYRGT